ncbi:MAG: hypothetical protein C0402_09445 [Thermodesulfovibrio sp.]|nr:hypothetical protein [Thermodesulfovibrio sp.]
MNSILPELVLPFPPRLLLEADSEHLASLKSEAINNNLFMLLYSQLLKHQEHAAVKKIAAKALEDWRPLYLKGIAHCMRQEAMEKEVVSLLGSHNIVAVVIRGNEIAREIYGNPNCRASSDIDILIRKPDVLRADSILSAAGYEKGVQEPVGYSLARIHHTTYIHPDWGICIELHWNFGVPYFFSLTSADIGEELSKKDPEGSKLSPEMIVIMLLIHHHSHSFREMRILVDIVWALHKYRDTIEWPDFAGRLETIGLLRITQITLDQIQRVWKDAPTTMPSLPGLTQGIQQRDCSSSVLLAFYFQPTMGRPQHSQKYTDKFIARFALDRPSRIMTSFFRTLFPSPDAVRELYRTRTSLGLPFLYLKFIVWRIRCWTGSQG